MSILDKLVKNSTIKLSAPLKDSILWKKTEMIITPVPMINAALSGRIDGGMLAGWLLICGPSKHFKTLMGLLIVASYMRKYPDAVMLYYDNEFGAGKAYFSALGIDPDRVLHTPITDIEVLKQDLMNQVDKINRGEHVIIFVDSIGNLASKKEVDDAIDQKSVADMTRAKALKSLFRMVTPHLTIKDIPAVVVNHIYMEQGQYPKAIVSGGTGPYLSADNIWIIGRAQEKEGDELTGYKFTINIDKSRFVKEKAKFPFVVSFEGGIQRWSGMFDLAREFGIIEMPTSGWYRRVDSPDTKNVRKSEIEHNDEFWKDIFKTTDFAEKIKKHYTLVSDGEKQIANTSLDFATEDWMK